MSITELIFLIEPPNYGIFNTDNSIRQFKLMLINFYYNICFITIKSMVSLLIKLNYLLETDIRFQGV